MKRGGLVWLLLVFVLVSCTRGQTEDDKKALTIVYAYQNAMNKKHLEYVKQALASQFPEYALRYIDINNYAFLNEQGKLSSHQYDYPGLETIGGNPDLIIEVVQGGSSRIFTQDYTLDLEGVLRTTDIDLNSFDQAYLNHIRAMSQDGSLRALPLTAELHALGYTKDADFTAQLADVHTWKDLIALSKQVPLSNFSNGYYNYWHSMAYQSGLRYWNEQDQIELDQESWERVLDTIRQLNFGATSDYKLMPYSTLEMLANEYKGLDLHPMPRISETDFAGPNRLYQLVTIGPSTKRKDDALKVLEYMTSYEFQLGQARQGIGSVLNRAEVRDQFGADNEYFNGMEVKSFFALRSSETSTAISKYDRSDMKNMLAPPQRDIDLYAYIDPFIRQMISDKRDPATVFNSIQAQLALFEKFILGKPVGSY